MFKWYMIENFSLKVLKIAVFIYGFLLYLQTGISEVFFGGFEY